MVAIFPCRDRGMGHTPLEIIAAPAFLASLGVAARDKSVQQHLHLLEQDIANAHTKIHEAVGHNSRALNLVRSVLPATPDEIVHGGFFSLQHLKNSKKRVQATVVSAIVSTLKDDFTSVTLECAKSTDPQPGLTKNDASLLLIAGNCSQLSRTLRSDLWYRTNRVPPLQFRNTMRLLLNLPPNSTLGNPTFVPEHGAHLDMSTLQRATGPHGGARIRVSCSERDSN